MDTLATLSGCFSVVYLGHPTKLLSAVFYRLVFSLSLLFLFLVPATLLHAQTVSLSTTSLNFGNQAIGTTSAARSVRLTNTGTAPLVINSISAPSAPFSESDNCPLTPASLASQAYCTITATFAPATTGSFSGSISIADNATGTPQAISLLGTGVQQATLSASSISFGSQGIGTVSSIKTITLTNNLNTSLTITSATASGDFATTTAPTNPCGSSLAAGGRCSIGVTFSPTQLGTRTGTLTVTDSASNSPQTANLAGTGSPSSLTSLTVSPLNPSIPVGGTQAFMATGTFSGSITLDVTKLVSWSSSSTTIASISNTSPNQGVATGKATGTATIMAALNGLSNSTTLSVGGAKIAPTITWTTPVPITYGTALSGTQLNANASVAGTFVYTPVAGTILPAGNQLLSVLFTPTDTTHYTNAAASVTLAVNRLTVTPAVTVNNKPYDGTTTATIATRTLTGVLSADTSNVSLTGNTATFSDANVGNGKTVTVTGLSLTGSAAGNYQLSSTSASTTASITGITVTPAVTVSDKPYDGTTTATIATRALTGVLSADTSNVSLTGNTATFSDANVGNGKTVTVTGLSLTGSAAGNYQLSSTSASTTASITGITVTPAVTVSDKPYDGTTTATIATRTLTGVLSADASNVSLTGGTATFSDANVGNGKTVTVTGLSLSGSAAGNYQLSSTSATTTASITASAIFTTAASMSTGRYAPTATLLNDGRVLVAGGGTSDGGAAVSSADVYDPATGVFTPTTGSMSTGRYHHKATLLNNGRVLLTGGTSDGGTALSSAEIYDSATGTLTLAGSMSAERLGHAAALLNDGRVLVVGGATTNGTILSGAEIYDPVAGIFTATGSMSTGRNFPTATLLNDGRVLVTGGNSGSGFPNTAEIYDPATGTFTPTIGNMNAGRYLHTATLLNNGRVLIAGGYNGSYLSSAEIYDPATGQFTTTGSLSRERINHTATLLNDGQVLVAGGYDGGSFPLAVLSSADIYDPATGTFAPTGSLSMVRSGHAATLLNNGQVLVSGGDDITGAGASTADLYTPAVLTPANLVSIAVTPTAPTLSPGTTQQFIATGTFSDSSKQVLQSVTWSSSSTVIATISNDATNQGTALAVAAGSSTITASDGTISGSALLTASGSTYTYTFTACMDGRDLLMIQGSTLQWQHLDYQAVGLANDCPPGATDAVGVDTTNNGTAGLSTSWLPTWAQNPPPSGTLSSTFTGLSPALPSGPMTVSLNVIAARTSLTIYQQPSAANDWTLILDFNDDPLPGATVYIGEVTVTVQ